MIKKLLLSLTLLSLFGLSSTAIASKKSSFAEEESTLNSKIPIAFIENKGQLITKKGKQNNHLLYKANGKGVNLYLTRNGLSYLFTRKISTEKSHDKHDKLIQKEAIAYHRITMKLEGANTACEVINELPLESYQNYYLGKTAINAVHSFQKVTYKNIYPKIDWVVYAQQDEVKYDFFVHPGGDPSRIKLVYQDQNGLQLTEDKDLQLKSYLGEIVDQKPFTYQGNKQEVASSFQLKKNTVSFSISNYNKQEDLVIDPGIIWSTYFGGTN